MITKEVMVHVKNTIDTLKKTTDSLDTKSFEDIKNIIESENKSMPGMCIDKYTGMVVSVIKGHSNDEDVLWHKPSGGFA